MVSSIQEMQTNAEPKEGGRTLLVRTYASPDSVEGKEQAEYRLYGALGRLAHIITDIAQNSPCTQEIGKSDVKGDG